MKNFKSAFTMIELVFVIVILGILASVAIPKLSGYMEDANYAQAMATVSSIRSAIVSERQSNLIKGSAAYPEILDDAGTGNHEALFDGNTTVNILQYPIYSKDASDTSGWMKTSNNAGTVIGYRFYINSTTSVDFNYTKATGVFDCDHTNTTCQEMTE